MAVVKLKKGREKSLLNRHPWVFSGAVDSVEGPAGVGADGLPPGEVVDVVDAAGNWLARGYYNGNSNIRVRVLEWDEQVEIDDSWWRNKLAAAVDRRTAFAADDRTNAYRLVHAEADTLPGLIVDRYGDFLAVQFLTAGVERVRPSIVDMLNELVKPVAVFDRSDADTRRREKLQPSTGLIAGRARDGPVEVLENGCRFFVDFSTGQKTGFYLDQRDNRDFAAKWARGRAVLDAFCYSGAFSVYAGRAGAASLTLVESSKTAIGLARQNLALNEVAGVAEFVQGDVFDVLRSCRDEERRFGMVILDPPKFARTRKQADQALRGYKDINLLAMDLLEPSGILVTFSCSGGVDTRQFTTAVSWAGLDAGRDVQILQRLGQPEDHPVLTSVPESEYLKGLICRLS
jgi:23S rRNA (cytosine1962-C5)-methyltransferase